MPSTITIPHRRSIRLKDYDYRQPGAYFVTLVTHKRICCFGEITGEQMRLYSLGELAASQWRRLADRFPSLSLDEWVVMPNHLHGIVMIHDQGAACSAQDRDAGIVSLRPYGRRENVEAMSLGALIRAYKSAVAFRVYQTRSATRTPLWQRNYYEHIIRNDWDLERIREYIRQNPKRWAEDEENPGLP